MADRLLLLEAVAREARAALSACRMANVRTLGAIEELEALDRLDEALEALDTTQREERTCEFCWYAGDVERRVYCEQNKERLDADTCLPHCFRSRATKGEQP